MIQCILLDEELIKWGWPEDVWFHVDKLSSAHVYLRLKEVRKNDNFLHCFKRQKNETSSKSRSFLRFMNFFIQNQTLDDVPMSIIEDAAQLVKYNSIQGNKMNDIDVVYTMWGNLHKTEGMEVGQVNISDIFVRKSMNQSLVSLHSCF